MTHDDFLVKLKEVHNDLYIPLNKYIKTHEKMKFKCNSDFCGNNIFELTPNKILNGRGCQICGKERSRVAKLNDTKSFKENVKIKTNGKYELVGEYKDYYTPVEIKHTECNKIYLVKPSKFNQGNRCPDCANKRVGMGKRLSNDDFINKVKLLGLDKKFIIKDKYVKHDIHLNIECKKCSHEFLCTPHNLTNNLTSCPKCSTKLPTKSKASYAINEYLEELEFDFEVEFRISECRDKRPLPFDFAIYDLDLLLEYDGEQHHKVTRFKNAEERFNKQILHDNIKNNFCIENGISLLRIPYNIKPEIIYEILKLLKTFNGQSKDVLYNRIEEMGGVFISKFL